MNDTTRRQALTHLHAALRELTAASRLDTRDELDWETADRMDRAFDDLKSLIRATSKEDTR